MRTVLCRSVPDSAHFGGAWRDNLVRWLVPNKPHLPTASNTVTLRATRPPSRSSTAHIAERTNHPVAVSESLPERPRTARGGRRRHRMQGLPSDRQTSRRRAEPPYGASPARSSCCLRHPYRVTPRGLYTATVSVRSNISRPPTEWTNVPGRSRGSATAVAVSAK